MAGVQMPGRMLTSIMGRTAIRCSVGTTRLIPVRQVGSSSRVLQQNEVLSSDPQSSLSDVSPAAQRGVTDKKAARYQSEPIPNNLPGPLERSKVHQRTHNHHVATLRLQSQGDDLYVENLGFFTDFAVRVAYAMGIPVSRPAALPMRKSLWTVPRGPFVHKKSQENFERRTHAQVIKVWDANADVVDQWLHFLRIHSMYGVTMRAETFAHVPLGFGEQMLTASTAQLRSIPDDALSTQAAKDTVRASEADVDKIRQLAENIVQEELAQPEASDNQASAIEGEETEPPSSEDADVVAEGEGEDVKKAN